MPFLTLVLVSGVGVMVRDRNVQVGAEEVFIWGMEMGGGHEERDLGREATF